MEFRRVFRSVVFYLLPLFEVFLMIMSLLIGEKANVTITLHEELQDVLSFMSYIFMASNMVMIFFWSSEYRHGFIKNYAGNVKGRHIPVIAKMIVGFTVNIMYVLSFMIFVVIRDMLDGFTVQMCPVGDLGRDYILAVLIGTATLAVSLLLFELSHSSALGYVFAVSLCVGIAENLLVNICYLINERIEIGKYLLILGNYWEGNSFAVNIIRTGLYLAACLTGAAVLAKKRDLSIK